MGNGKARLKEDGYGRCGDEENYGPDAERGTEAMVIEKVLEKQRDEDTTKTGASLDIMSARSNSMAAYS